MSKKVKAALKHQEHFENALEGKRCLMTISVGQEHHESEKLECTIALINETF